jgi:hypothetical protein
MTNRGHISGVVAALAVLWMGQFLAQAADPAQFVHLSTPADLLVQSNDSMVSLASCCETTRCESVSSGEGGCCPHDCHAKCDACNAGCQAAACNACGSGALLDGLTGWLAPSDKCFNCFVSPMTNPFFFEDPRTLSEARFIYAHQKVPLTAAGGDFDLMVVQLRAALTDRLSVIATKDGFLTSDNPLIDDGWPDVNVGLKYNWLRDPARQMLYTVGATYELPVGSTRSLQGNGDGTIHLFSSFGKRIYAWNWLLAHGWIVPIDEDEESEWFYVSNHVSRRLGGSNFYALAELNWYNWLSSGTNGFPGFEGLDLFNFGSTQVTGNDIVTGAFGVKYKPRDNVELGAAWENPLTDRRDVLENRLTFDAILRY